MTAAAEGLDDETPAASSLYGDVMVYEAGLEIECAFRAFGLCFDDFRVVGIAVGRFFIGYENHFAREIIARIVERFQSRESDAVAALHVQDPGAVRLAVFDGEGALLYFAFMKYGIDVAHEDHVWLREIPSLADDGVATFFKRIAANGEAQFLQAGSAEISDLHAPFFHADTGVDGNHLSPQIYHLIPVGIHPGKCFFFDIHNVSLLSVVIRYVV